MKHSLGFLSIDIESNEESNFIINYINSISSLVPYHDLILFNSVYKRIDNSINKFSIMHVNEAKYFKGTIIAFNLKNMLLLQHCIGKKIFYSIKPEWIDLSKNIKYNDLKSLYVDSADILAIPTQEETDIYKLCWKDACVIDTKDYKRMIEYAELQ